MDSHNDLIPKGIELITVPLEAIFGEAIYAARDDTINAFVYMWLEAAGDAIRRLPIGEQEAAWMGLGLPDKPERGEDRDAYAELGRAAEILVDDNGTGFGSDAVNATYDAVKAIKAKQGNPE